MRINDDVKRNILCESTGVSPSIALFYVIDNNIINSEMNYYKLVPTPPPPIWILPLRGGGAYGRKAQLKHTTILF